MKILLNGGDLDVKASNLSELVAELSLPDKGIAVAVSKKMVPKSDWERYPLKDGDDIIVIKAVCGG